MTSNLRAGQQVRAGFGFSTVLADMDFETYSPAGYDWNGEKWQRLKGTTKYGLSAVGMPAYITHPGAEILSLAYDLKDGIGPRLWVPGCPPPTDLFAHFAAGRVVEAFNSGFEFWAWTFIGCRLHGWPGVPQELFRCAMAKARAHGLPGSLADLGRVLNLDVQKDADGKRLLDKFSTPRQPTKKDPRLRVLPSDDPVDAAKLYRYNVTDIAAESAASLRVPDLPPSELEFWLADQRINLRGVQLDMDRARDCAAVVDAALEKYDAELLALTGGAVEKASQVQRLIGWLAMWGVQTRSLDDENIEILLALEGLPPQVRRALKIRQLAGSAAVKKVYAMLRTATPWGRACEMFRYHLARTGRAGGEGVQPQNLPNAAALRVKRCEDSTCRKHFGTHLSTCPYCGSPDGFHKVVEWSAEAAEEALAAISFRSLEWLEHLYGDALEIVGACLRGLLVAGPGKDLICSDYSAIEAVVLAALAGEEWRLEVFRTHGKIYEMSASKITGVPFEEYARYKAETGSHHPTRKTVGKVAELASGYAGWVGAWKAFGADEFYTDAEIKDKIIAWRDASPAIVEFWGGQFRGLPWDPNRRAELYGLEGMAVAAISNPGFEYKLPCGIGYFVHEDVLYCRLLSGRLIAYHRPRLTPNGDRGYEISFEGWNSNPKMGPQGWVRMTTYSGKLTENVVQATARDILAHAIVNLEKANYPVVLHIHDEIAAEIPEGWGSVEEFERIMATMPAWCAGWPLKAAGGWRGKRYRKD